jgi:hypothetical protein
MELTTEKKQDPEPGFRSRIKKTTADTEVGSELDGFTTDFFFPQYWSLNSGSTPPALFCDGFSRQNLANYLPMLASNLNPE